MSKAIRIKDHLYEEIARRAELEHRPIITQLEMLLEQAMRLDPGQQLQGATKSRAENTSKDPHAGLGWPGEERLAKTDFGSKLKK